MSAPSRVPAPKRQRGACGVDKKIEMCYNSKTVVSEVYLIGSKIDRTVLQRPSLRRKDNLLYYGSMADKYIIMMQILDTKKIKDLDVATRVSVQLQLTDPDLKSRDRVVKKTEKDGLYNAMDVAAVWLDRALANN